MMRAQIGKPARVWSPMQEAIFLAVETLQPGHHIVCEALAGSGKSTTIEQCVHETPEGSQVLVCAFNKSIADAMRERLPFDVEVATLHSLGGRIVRSAMGNRRVDTDKKWLRVQLKHRLGFEWNRREVRTACEKLISLAKGCLCPADPVELDELADEYGIEIDPYERTRVASVAADLLTRCRDAEDGTIDFDDMIWLPEVRDLAAPTWDYVFVDETQDLNAAQLALVQRVAGDDGRIVAVGDRRQSIYQFRGADKRAIPRMIEELQAKTLPLSITYRCPLAVVREANNIVPELQARPGAPEGIVRTASVEELKSKAAAGDMVLSRTNAPLISLCYAWLASGRKALIQGREIGQGLITWIEHAGCESAPQLVRKVREWLDGEVKRLTAAERDTQAACDKAACIEALCAGCRTVEDVMVKAHRLFGEVKGDVRDCILLSSTHRAKGLEAERVWLLRDTYLRWPGDEEKNLLYVACTRSKHELIYVRTEQ